MAKEPKPIARAFPGHTNPRPGVLADAEPGMTLHQYYAGQAIIGILAMPESPGLSTEESAALAFRVADYMVEFDAARPEPFLPIAAGRLCREVLIMCDRLESGRGNFNGGDLVAIAAAWRMLVENCVAAGVSIPGKGPTNGKA